MGVSALRRQKRRRYAWRHRAGKSWRLAALVLSVTVIMACIDARMRPVIENMAAYQVKVFAIHIINNAIIKELENKEVDYGDFIEITYAQNGDISAIHTDMRAINALKSRIAGAIASDLAEKSDQSLRIPIGTLMGNQMTSGRGPRVEIRVVPTGYVQTQIGHQFLSAGINQTLHQLTLETSVHIIAIVPGYTVRTETTTNFCIAETVIVGNIPDSFAQIDLGNTPVYAKLEEIQPT